MKILFVSSLYPSRDKPQYCIFIEQQAKALCSLGQDVDILVLKPSSKFNGSVGMISEPIIQNGLKVYTWYYQSSKYSEIAITPIEMSNISFFLQENSYDAISLHMGELRAFNAIANVCQSLKTIVLKHYHGLNVWSDYCSNWKQKIITPYRNWREIIFLKKINAVIGVSNCVCNIVKKRLPNIPVYTVYNGVNPHLFGKQQLSRNKKHFTVLCVANLIPTKGQLYLLEAVSDLVKKGRDIILQLIGEGPDLDFLKTRSDQLSISSRVIFFGSKSYEDVAYYMRNADVFVLPSFYEAFGCVFLESMASGTVTCGCYGGGAEEIILNGETGFLVRPKNTEDIINVISYVMDNPQKCEEIIKRGMHSICSFTWMGSASRLLEIYNCILNK